MEVSLDEKEGHKDNPQCLLGQPKNSKKGGKVVLGSPIEVWLSILEFPVRRQCLGRRHLPSPDHSMVGSARG